MLVTDSAESTLQGAIDGSNRLYQTSLSFDPESVTVFVNGRAKEPSLLDGFVLHGPNQVELREALLVGDTLAVQYEQPGEASQGGAPPVPAPCLSARADGAPSPRLRVEVDAPARVRLRVQACEGSW